MVKVALILTGLTAGIFAIAKAKTGHGILFSGWLLLPPSAYLAGIASLLCLVVGAFLVGRGRREL